MTANSNLQKSQMQINELMERLQSLAVEAGAWMMSGGFVVAIFWFASSMF